MGGTTQTQPALSMILRDMEDHFKKSLSENATHSHQARLRQGCYGILQNYLLAYPSKTPKWMQEKLIISIGHAFTGPSNLYEEQEPNRTLKRIIRTPLYDPTKKHEEHYGFAYASLKNHWIYTSTWVLPGLLQALFHHKEDF